MEKVVTIVVCDYPDCNNDRQLVNCSYCSMVVCPAHRFEGTGNDKATGRLVQAFICWEQVAKIQV